MTSLLCHYWHFRPIYTVVCGSNISCSQMMMWVKDKLLAVTIFFSQSLTNWTTLTFDKLISKHLKLQRLGNVPLSRLYTCNLNYTLYHKHYFLIIICTQIQIIHCNTKRYQPVWYFVSEVLQVCGPFTFFMSFYAFIVKAGSNFRCSILTLLLDAHHAREAGGRDPQWGKGGSDKQSWFLPLPPPLRLRLQQLSVDFTSEKTHSWL